MTTLLPGRSRDSVVTGLAMLGSRVRHDRKVKCVDAGPGNSVRAGRLLPNDGEDGRRRGSLGPSSVDEGVADISRRRTTGSSWPLSPFAGSSVGSMASARRCQKTLHRRAGCRGWRNAVSRHGPAPFSGTAGRGRGHPGRWSITDREKNQSINLADHSQGRTKPPGQGLGQDVSLLRQLAPAYDSPGVPLTCQSSA